ncbi:MAG: hypothetical protein ACXQS8_05655, partial [Candidatus Helarchaeales archaeon]
YTVEHELMHAVQAAANESAGYDHWGNNEDIPWDEGMATWAGIESTRHNFNLTWNQTMEYFKIIGKANWFEHYRDTNMSLWPWPGSGWDRYIGMGLFLKFLNETYGLAKIIEIYKGLKDYYGAAAANHTDINATTSIENALGVPFNEVWRRYQEWLVNGSATAANGFPKLKPHETITVPGVGNSTTATTNVNPKASVIEFINTTGINHSIHLKFNAANTSRWRITIIYTFPDGTSFSLVYYYPEDTLDTITISKAAHFANITIIKTNILDSGPKQFNLTIDSFTTQHVESGRLIRDDNFIVISMDQAIWVENGTQVGITLYNSTGGSENFLTFQVFNSTEDNLMWDHMIGEGAWNEANPKTFTWLANASGFYWINIFWIQEIFGPIPPEGVLCDFMIEWLPP